ncbi:hypothetical protein [Roseicyclus sp.]
MTPLLRHLAILAALLVTPLAAAAQNDEAEDVLAVIGPAEITQDDVSRTLQSRPDLFPDLPEEERRQRTLQRIVAEVLVDYLYGQNPEDLSTVDRERLSDARRQVLFRHFAQARFTPPTVTEDDVDAFVEDNPHLFSEHAFYRYLDISLGGGTAEARQDAVARIVQQLRGPGPDLAALQGQLAELEERGGLDTTLHTRWTSSGAIEADIRLRLEAMAARGRAVDAADENGSNRILMLLDVVQAPIPPDKMRDEIRAQIRERAYAAHRETLVRRMAASVMPDLSASEGPELEPLGIVLPDATAATIGAAPVEPRASRVVALLMSWLFGVVGIYAILSWVALVRRQYPLQRARLTSVAILGRPAPAGLLGAVLALGQGAVLVAAVVLGSPTLGPVLTGGAVLVALLAGGGIGWVLQERSERSRRKTEDALRAKLSDDGLAERQALLREQPVVRLRAAVMLLLASMLAGLVLLGDAMAGV